MTGRRSNQLNYAPERREIVAAAPALGRAPGVSADLKGEPRRLDRGGRHRARPRSAASGAGSSPECCRSPGSWPARSSGARFAPEIVGGAEPVRSARRARRRGDRRDARTDGRGRSSASSARGLISILPPLRWLDSAGGSALGLVHGPRDLLGRRRDAPLPPRPDRGPAACAGVARRLCAHGGAAARDGHGRGRADRPVRRDRGACGRSRSARSRDRAASPPFARRGRRSCASPASPAGSASRDRGGSCGPGLVVTNAHVVAGIDRPEVDRRDGNGFEARVVSFDAHNDVAILRVPGCRAGRSAAPIPTRGEPAALLGFPEQRPVPRDARADGPAAKVGSGTPTAGSGSARTVVALRGDVKPGTRVARSWTATGGVIATMFGRARGRTTATRCRTRRCESALANDRAAARDGLRRALSSSRRGRCARRAPAAASRDRRASPRSPTGRRPPRAARSASAPAPAAPSDANR